MVIDAVLQDVVEVANVLGGVEGLVGVSLWELVTDGVTGLVRPDAAVDPELAPVAALAAAAAAAPAPAPIPAPAPLFTFSLLLLVSLSLVFSLLLVQPLLSKDLL